MSLSSNNALLEFILHSTPAIQEHLLDSKKDVDRRLKAVCEQFIADCSVGILRSVMEINSKVATFQAMRADKQAKLSSQPWADTNILTTAVTETVKLIKQNVRSHSFNTGSNVPSVRFLPFRGRCSSIWPTTRPSSSCSAPSDPTSSPAS